MFATGRINSAEIFLILLCGGTSKGRQDKQGMDVGQIG